MIAAGAPLVDMADDIAWFTPAGWGVRFPSDLRCSPLLDRCWTFTCGDGWVLNPRINIMDNTHVLGLVRDANAKPVAGVLISSRNGDVDRTVARKLRCDLIVDATGRASRAPSGSRI